MFNIAISSEVVAKITIGIVVYLLVMQLVSMQYGGYGIQIVLMNES